MCFGERDMTAVFLSINAKTHNSMSNQKHSRRVASEKVRGILNELADAVCQAQDKVILSLTGNTFEIHLEGGTINITVCQEGGAS